MPTLCSIVRRFRKRQAMKRRMREPIERYYDNVQHGLLIGEGGYADVRKVIRKSDGKVFACKQLRSGTSCPKTRKLLLQEGEILMSLDHPNIVKAVDLFQNRDEVYLVMELCEGGDLGTKFQLVVNNDIVLPDEAVQVLVKQMLSAVTYMHRMGLCHRDLKLENMVLTNARDFGSLKVIDFGLSQRFKPGKKMTQVMGSPHTIAPEVLGEKYTEKADMWSIGVITYMLLSNRCPFESESEIKYSRVTYRGMNSAASAFLRCLLQRVVYLRSSASEALAHPWLAGSGCGSTRRAQ